MAVSADKGGKMKSSKKLGLLYFFIFLRALCDYTGNVQVRGRDDCEDERTGIERGFSQPLSLGPTVLTGATQWTSQN